MIEVDEKGFTKDKKFQLVPVSSHARINEAMSRNFLHSFLLQTRQSIDVNGRQVPYKDFLASGGSLFSHSKTVSSDGENSVNGLGMTLNRLLDQAEKIGIDRQEAKSAAVELYQQKYITYPMTDGSCLPIKMKYLVGETLEIIGKFAPDISVPAVSKVNDDFFVEDYYYSHMPIIPCHDTDINGVISFAQVGKHAEQIYRLIAEEYIKCVIEH